MTHLLLAAALFLATVSAWAQSLTSAQLATQGLVFGCALVVHVIASWVGA